jgi:cell division protein FtsN
MSTRRDYKPRSQIRHASNNRRADRSGGVPGWLWLLTGAAVGSFAMFLFELHQDRGGQEPPPSAQSNAVELPPAGASVPAPSAAEEPPSFDFYTLLPEKRITIPEDELRTETDRSVSAPSWWTLQAGSFRVHADADKLKATLAFQGLESTIDSVAGDNGTWYRVRLGPYESRREVDRIRSNLAKQNIDALILSSSP